MSAHNDILVMLAAYQAENEKFEQGDEGAGTRALLSLTQLSTALKKRRREIEEIKNSHLIQKKL